MTTSLAASNAARKSAHSLAPVLCMVLGLGLAAPAAHAGLDIHPVFVGEAPPPPPGAVVGGGDLEDIFEAAAEAWERVFNGRGRWDVTIRYDWSPLVAHLYGQEEAQAESGRPKRISESFVTFNNQADTEFFADPTPRDHDEYLRFSAWQSRQPFAVNHSRLFDDAQGDAEARIDLLTIATHEIGHALGLDDTYSGLHALCPGGTCSSPIRGPRPWTGLQFTINQGPHFNSPFVGPEGGGEPLMAPKAPIGGRQLISVADALLLGQISSFKPNLKGMVPPPPPEW